MRLRTVAGIVVAAAAACSTFERREEAERDAGTGDAGTDLVEASAPFDAARPDDAGEVDAGADVDASGCPVGPEGPEMVEVALTGKTLCVDRTEITRSRYVAFKNRDQLPPLAGKVPPECVVGSVGALSAAGAPGELPQVDVSFCSAAVYCVAQGKRLCGDPDGKRVIKRQDQVDPPLEWDLACANGQSTALYPWGSGPEGAKPRGCLTQSTSPAATGPRDAGAARLCGPPDGGGPYDMIGNVQEWVNLRSDQDGGASYTGVRGGAFDGVTVADGCRSPHGVDGPPGQYASGRPTVGFRCCADRR